MLAKEEVMEVDFIPTKACFAQAPEWEDSINEATKYILRTRSFYPIGDRRFAIGLFNAMLEKAPRVISCGK